MLRILLLVGVIGLVFSCSNPSQTELVNHNEWSAQTHLAKWPDVKHLGIGVGFVRPEDRNLHPYERPSNERFDIPEGTAFATLLILSTGDDRPAPVFVSAFLDYEQVNFSLDGRFGLLHYLEIQPGVDMEIPLEVSTKTPGWHDFFVVVFPEPARHPTDSQDRLPPKFAVGGRRAVICTADCTLPARTIPQAIVGRFADAQNMNAYAFPLLPGSDLPNRRLLLSTDVHPGELYKIELWARNPSNRSRNYIVIPLIDFRQTAFAGSELLHLQVPSGGELFIPGEIRVPDNDGVHELQFVYIFDPYRDITEVKDPFVQSIMRSALVVQ